MIQLKLDTHAQKLDCFLKPRSTLETHFQKSDITFQLKILIALFYQKRAKT